MGKSSQRLAVHCILRRTQCLPKSLTSTAKQDPSLLLLAGRLTAGGSIWGALLAAGEGSGTPPQEHSRCAQWPGCHDAQVQISVLWEAPHRSVRVSSLRTRGWLTPTAEDSSGSRRAGVCSEADSSRRWPARLSAALSGQAQQHHHGPGSVQRTLHGKLESAWQPLSFQLPPRVPRARKPRTQH